MNIQDRTPAASDRSSQPDASAILDAALDAVITADHEGRVLSYNKAAERLFGYPRERVLGRRFAELVIPPRHRARHEDAFRHHVETGQSRILGRRVELSALRADGSEFPVEISIVRQHGGATVCFTAFIRDLTEQKQAERIQRENETWFRALIENASDMITLVKSDATILFQARSISLLGYTPAELVGRNALELIHPDDLKMAAEALAGLVAQPGATASAEFRFRHKDGSWRLLAAIGKNALDVPGVNGIVINSRDVTEARAAERAQARLAAILDATPDYVGLSDANRKPLYINRAGRRMIGIGEREDVTTLSVTDFHTATAGRVVSEVGVPTAMRDGIWSGETVLRSRTGEETPVSQVIIAHRDSAGRVEYLSTICRDISERQRAAVAQQRLLDVFDKSPEGYALYDPDDRLVFANHEYRRLMQESDHLLVPGAKYSDILRAAVAAGEVPEAIGNEEAWIAQRLERRRTSSTPFDVQRGKDRRWLRVREQVLPDGSIFMVRTDVTADKLRDAQLVQAQKMEVVGQLTGGIAHDFNNLLAVIQGNLELLSEFARDDQTVAKFVAPALRAALRGGELTQRLLAFSRRQMLRPEAIDLNTLVPEVSELLRRTLGAAITIELELAPEPCVALVDASQLENALLNLAVNARDAMPRGGRLAIATRLAQLKPGDIDGPDEVTAGCYAVVTVADTGQGMPPEVLARVYEPFFTTKGTGSGLGLSMVYGFVKQSGGHIRIDSTVGLGTSVALYLPYAGTERGRAAVDADRLAMPVGKGETVLVVEDDAEVRELVVNQLSGLGYRVRQTDCAATALDFLLQSEEKIDLLLTDIVLPGGMSGVALMRSVRESFPAMRILCMSGYAQQAMADEEVTALDATLINKPFRHADLARAVRAALDGD
jgi:PAS domain S-box-containing protein